jgi:hypothetical protein
MRRLHQDENHNANERRTNRFACTSAAVRPPALVATSVSARQTTVPPRRHVEACVNELVSKRDSGTAQLPTLAARSVGAAAAAPPIWNREASTTVVPTSVFTEMRYGM